MTPFMALSPLVRACLALWVFMLCLSGIFSAVISWIRKKYLFVAFSLVLLTQLLFLWQVIFDLTLSERGISTASSVTEFLCGIPFVWWIAALVLLTSALGLLLGFGIRYERSFITPASIKSFLDQIPCGVCCYQDSGKVDFSNVCMNRLCAALTDGPLLNGDQFYQKVGDGIHAVEDRMWRFSRREIDLDGEHLYELIASDITNEYAQTQALERDRTELSRINRELKEYTLSIGETVRRQEILQAKISIHDEMNRLMLSTMAAESDDTDELDRIFSLWEQNALLLGTEADEETESGAIGSLEKLASALKIRLNWKNDLPGALSNQQRNLFLSAAQEAIANAVKHAGAKSIDISFEEIDSGICCRFVNDGTFNRGSVKFTGGLANLDRVAREQGASVSAVADESFMLSICFPRQNHPIG